jgi:hypothetical protein
MLQKWHAIEAILVFGRSVAAAFETRRALVRGMRGRCSVKCAVFVEDPPWFFGASAGLGQVNILEVVLNPTIAADVAARISAVYNC